MLRLVLASLAVAVASELAFTLYADAYSLADLIGHYLKIVSFFLIYQAFIHLGLAQPYSVLFRSLKQSEERFEQIAGTINYVFWVVELDPEGVLYVSPAFERLWGLPAAQIYADPRVWVKAIHPDDQPRVQQAFEAWLRDPRPRGDGR